MSLCYFSKCPQHQQAPADIDKDAGNFFEGAQNDHSAMVEEEGQ
jgi:hypothetical protein